MMPLVEMKWIAKFEIDGFSRLAVVALQVN